MGTINTTEKALDIVGDAIGTIAAQPTSGSMSVVRKYVAGFCRIDITLTAARIPVVDAAGSGSSGSLKLMDMAEGAWHVLSSRQSYTAFASDGTGVPADTVFDIGVGTAAIAAAADGVLTASATYDNVGAKVDHTLGGAYAGTALDLAALSVDGTGTPMDLHLNWSGTAATVDGDGWVDVTGVISIAAVHLGDD